MLALYQVLRADGHVITQVVETEFIVRSECDICQIGLAACIGIRLMTVDAVYAESVEHVKRSHPFGVTFCQVVVHGYYVYAVSGQCIQEYGEGSHQGFTFTCCHFGNFTFVQYHATEQLYVIVNHVPHRVVAAGVPMVLPDGFVTFDADKVLGCCQCPVKVSGRHHYFFVFRETLGRFFYNRESNR